MAIRTLPLALVAAALMAGSATANVELLLYNSEQVLDFDATPLLGTTSSGDLVQLLLVGANGVIDEPLTAGTPGGDDSLVSATANPTHVGVGVATANNGKLSQSGMVYADALAGQTAYVRFWNHATADLATYYGDSALTNLPAADAFGQGEMDFVPTLSDPRTANKPTSVLVPTLTEWGLVVLAGLVLATGGFHVFRQQPDLTRR